MYHRTVQISGPRQYSKLDRMFQRFLATLKYVPDDFTRARIYKKGDPDNPEHYRPISLLNTRYNFFAYIIKKIFLTLLTDTWATHSSVSEKADPQ